MRKILGILAIGTMILIPLGLHLAGGPGAAGGLLRSLRATVAPPRPDAGAEAETAALFLSAYADRLAFDPAEEVVFVNGHALAAEDSAHLLSLTGGPARWASRFAPPVGGPDPDEGITVLASVPLPDF